MNKRYRYLQYQVLSYIRVVQLKQSILHNSEKYVTNVYTGLNIINFTLFFKIEFDEQNYRY
jgi:hypothetical protein